VRERRGDGGKVRERRREREGRERDKGGRERKGV